MPEVNLRFVALTNGLMYRIGQSWPLTGVVLERYSSGQIKSRSGVVNGRLEGLSEGWHTNSVRQVGEPFRAGKSHGLRRKWYASGRLLSTAEIVAGQLHGVFRQWHENGRMAEEIPMRHGQPHGVSRAWFPDGALKARACLVAGNVQEQEYFEDNGMRLASPK